MMITAVLTSGGLPGVTGLLMKIHIDLMFYWLVGLVLLMFIDVKMIFKGLDKRGEDSNSIKIEMKEKLVK